MAARSTAAPRTGCADVPGRDARAGSLPVYSLRNDAVLPQQRDHRVNQQIQIDRQHRRQQIESIAGAGRCATRSTTSRTVRACRQSATTDIRCRRRPARPARRHGAAPRPRFHPAQTSCWRECARSRAGARDQPPARAIPDSVRPPTAATRTMSAPHRRWPRQIAGRSPMSDRLAPTRDCPAAAAVHSTDRAPKTPADMIDRMHQFRIDEHAARLVERECLVFPTVPKLPRPHR